MRRFLLDTGPAHDLINRRQGVLGRVDTERQAGNRIVIGTPVLGELWSAVEGSASRERNLQRLRLALSRLVDWPCTDEAAAQYGRVFAELRRVGRPMQQIDIMIAAIAFALGDCTVVTKDSDVKAVSGLVVESW